MCRCTIAAAMILCAFGMSAKDVTLTGATTNGANADIKVTYALNSTEKIARVKKVTDKNGIDGKKSCVIPSSITVEGVKYKVTKIGEKAFAWCTDNPDGTTEVHIRHGFRTVVLPNTIVEIGKEAFLGCEYLSTCDIPAKVQTIGDKAFNGSGLKSVRIPGSCRSIGKSAFGGNVSSLVIEDSSTPLVIGDAAFRHSDITSLVLPARVSSMGENVFYWCIYLKTVVINANMATLPKGTFEGSQLTSVQINGNVQEIGARAFYENNVLASVSFPPTLRSIGESAFEGSFWNGTTFNGVLALPAGLKTIGASAFKDCGITGIDIPSTVTAIGAGAFVGSKLRVVRCAAVIPPDTASWGLFDLDTYLNADLSIPVGSWEKYKTAIGWSSFDYSKYSSGIGAVEAGSDDDLPAEYYTIQGVRVDRDGMPAGIYIERRGSVTRKVSIR